MKVELWCFGKNTLKYLDEGIADYEKRIPHYIPFQMEVFQLPSSRKNETPDIIRKNEYELIRARIQSTDWIILLDEKGKQASSTDFADQMQQWFNAGHRRIVFIIGGAFGFHPELLDRANKKLSFSKMTFNHLLFRLIFLEQLYRAMTILRNEPYHH